MLTSEDFLEEDKFKRVKTCPNLWKNFSAGFRFEVPCTSLTHTHAHTHAHIDCVVYLCLNAVDRQGEQTVRLFPIVVVSTCLLFCTEQLGSDLV